MPASINPDNTKLTLSCHLKTPLATRYASQEMMSIFSARTRASTWRQLWVWLAEAEKELGLNIPDEAIEQMRQHVTVSDKAFDVAREYENKFRVSTL